MSCVKADGSFACDRRTSAVSASAPSGVEAASVPGLDCSDSSKRRSPERLGLSLSTYQTSGAARSNWPVRAPPVRHGECLYELYANGAWSVFGAVWRPRGLG